MSASASRCRSLDWRQACPSTRAGSRRRVSAWTLSGRGVALPATSTAPAYLARRSATRRAYCGCRPRACSTSRAPRRRRSARARASGRTPPSAARRTPAPPPPAAAPTRRAARRRELRVQDGDRVAEARDEPRDDLRRQRDLGHQHDHAAPVGEGVGRGLQVDLGLPRPGDAVQQQPLPRRGRAIASSAASWSPVSGGLRARAPTDT